jgi:hypothetical protein
MAMTDGISVDELEDRGSNNSIAEVSKVAEGLVWVCRGRLESVCVCAKGRRVEDCDGSSELLRAPANLGPSGSGHKTSRILSPTQFDFAPSRLPFFYPPCSRCSARQSNQSRQN